MKLLSLAMLALVVAGCATASTPTTPLSPYSTPEIEVERYRCLAAGKMWLETQDRYVCISPESLQWERT